MPPQDQPHLKNKVSKHQPANTTSNKLRPPLRPRAKRGRNVTDVTILQHQLDILVSVFVRLRRS